MSINVNPPPQLRIPRKFFNDPEARSFFERQQQIIFQLWNRTGGPSDTIASSGENITSTSSRVARNAAKINALEKESFDVEIITSDFTTSRNQIVICKNTSAITVTLDPNAIEEDTIHIKRAGAVVNVVGVIDGKSSLRLNLKYYSLHIVFDGTGWAII